MQRYPMGGFPASGPMWNGASDLLGHLEWGEFFGDVLHAGFDLLLETVVFLGSDELRLV